MTRNIPSSSSLLALLLIACNPSTSQQSTPPTPLVVAKLVGTCEIQENSLWHSLTNQKIYAGSRLRTGPESFLELKSISNLQRVLLSTNSEAGILRWTQLTSHSEEVHFELVHGLVLLDFPPPTPGASFQLKGSNFLVSVRSTGSTIVAVSGGGAVLVKTGAVICTLVPPVKGVLVNSGQMFDPLTGTSKAIPLSSNDVWTLLSN